MDKIIKKAINDLVWFIPIRRIRDSIRTIITYNINKNEEISGKLSLLINLINSEDNNFVIIEVSGGFTDQIFSYILGKYIELRYKKKVKYDISWYEDNGMDWNNTFKRNFELLNIFYDLDFDIENNEISKVCKSLYNISLMPITIKELDELMFSKNILYFFGRFSEITMYNEYKNVFNKLLDFDKYFIPLLDDKNMDLYKKILSSNCPVAIHIRLGDLIEGIKKIEYDYFIESINIICEKEKYVKPKFFIFSSDAAYVKNNIFNKDFYDLDYEFVNNTNDIGYIDFYMITKCKHVICSVGRFGYAAYNFINYEKKILILSKYIDFRAVEDFVNTGEYDISEEKNKYILELK